MKTGDLWLLFAIALALALAVAAHEHHEQVLKGARLAWPLESTLDAYDGGRP